VVIGNPPYVRQELLSLEPWSLEPPAVDELMAKITRVGIPLKDFAGCSPLYGIKTGFNEAFLIDDETRNKPDVENRAASDADSARSLSLNRFWVNP